MVRPLFVNLVINDGRRESIVLPLADQPSTDGDRLVKESQIQTAIEQYLRILEQNGRLVYIKNNSGAYRTGTGGFVRFGRSGSSDFLLFVDQGRCIHLEVKAEKGRQSKSQRDYQRLVERLGHKYLVVRSRKEVASLFDGTGFVPDDDLDLQPIEDQDQMELF